MDGRSLYMTHLNKVAQANVWAGLDPISIQIIKRVAVELEEHPITVTTLMGWADVQSPASMHRRMSRLVESGWLAVLPLKEDARIKRVELGQKGLEAFAAMGQVLK